MIRGSLITSALFTAIAVATAGAAACSHPASAANGNEAAPNGGSTAAVAASPVTPALAFVSWTEPQQQSFTIEVPKGWQATGGLNWTGPIDPQMFMHVASPDGKVRVFVGDPEILPRQVPSRWTQMQTGVAEGGIFRTPSGGRAMVQRFQSGIEYAKTHATQRICPQPAWLREADLPEAAREATTALAPEARADNVSMRVSAGEAGFDCNSALGYATSTTVLAQASNAPMQYWAVLNVAEFLASDAARAMEARYVLEHMVATLAKNPEWVRAWEARVRQVTGAVISMQNAETAAHLRAARNASDTLSRLNRPNPGVSRPRERAGSSVNTTLGTRHVCDAIGRCQTVSNDSDTVFIDHSGRVASGRAGGAPPDNTGVWAQMQ
jgi:hypothetical protein